MLEPNFSYPGNSREITIALSHFSIATSGEVKEVPKNLTSEVDPHKELEQALPRVVVRFLSLTSII